MEQAAEYLRKLYEDSTYYNEIKIRAQKYITEWLGEKRITEIIKSRCKEIFNLERENEK